MTDTKTSALPVYTTPIPADIVPVVDTTNSTLKGATLATLHGFYTNFSTASQTPFATDTYLTGSNIAVPSGAPLAGTTYEMYFDITKTNVGTATPIIQIRFGTAGTTADASICSFTFGAGTAAIDVAQVQIIATFRTVGSGTSAVLQGIVAATTNLATTGWSNAVKTKVTTSSGFDSTVASSIIGVSYNGGASAAHTVQLVRSKLTL